MKRIFLVLFVLTLLISISSCDSSKDDTNDKKVSDDSNQIEDNTSEDGEKKEGEDGEESENKDITIDEQVIYEGNDIIVTATGFDSNDLFGPSISVLIENNSDKNITVQSRNSSVNGLMIDTMFSADVSAGKKANDAITFSSSELEVSGITTIKDIELSLHIIETESWDTIIDTDTRVLNTTADASFVQEYDTSGSVVYDSDDIKIFVKKLNSSESFWGSDLYLFIENNRPEDITVQARDVSINGFMVDPIFSSDISAGKKAFDTITFMESDLTENNITDITDIELKFHIINLNTWDTIIDTDTVKISFD
ncbi:MAG: hypothetical protein PHC56_07695 [Herbinix sp.]|nr:hypothetical protein [Herbinix sp.]